jgi:hypothetical protein
MRTKGGLNSLDESDVWASVLGLVHALHTGGGEVRRLLTMHNRQDSQTKLLTIPAGTIVSHVGTMAPNGPE